MQKTELTIFHSQSAGQKAHSRRYTHTFFSNLLHLKRRAILSFHTPNASIKNSGNQNIPDEFVQAERQTPSDSCHLKFHRKCHYYHSSILLLTRWLFMGLLTSISFKLGVEELNRI